MAAEPEKPLQKELEYFESMRTEWIEKGYEGKWAVIVGNTLLGTFDSDQSAYQAAVERTGTAQNFLLKQILPEDPDLTIPALATGAIRVTV